MDVDAIAIAGLVVSALSLLLAIPSGILAMVELVDRSRRAPIDRRHRAARTGSRHRRR